MSLLANYVAEGAAVIFGGAFLYSCVSWWKSRSRARSITAQAEETLARARQEAESTIQDARQQAEEESKAIRQKAEEMFSARRQELSDWEKRLSERENLFNRQLEGVMEAEKGLAARKESLREQAAALEKERESVAKRNREWLDKLGKVGSLTASEARSRLLNEVEQQSLKDANQLHRKIIETARSEADEKAREIISLAIQRHAGEHTNEISTATVQLPSEDLKGRIIGRDGRNIRAFEAATGITVLIDDTPNAVVLSGFDPIRREIAREAMQRLLQDGRIHPSRIEEVVAAVEAETDVTIIRLGEEAIRKSSLPPFHPEIVKLLGQLHFRRSHSQNLLQHSVEVSQLTGLMAEELGVNVDQARRAGLLHDIGKAISHEVEGTHAIVGADFIRRYGESETVVNGVASHHNEVPAMGPLGPLVSAADAISASRPGARSETVAIYLKRVRDLEQIGLSFAGVEKCFAVHAGRELRVFVLPDALGDDEAQALARSISRKIEDQLQYPGQIRVTVIRETRCTEIAK